MLEGFVTWLRSIRHSSCLGAARGEEAAPVDVSAVAASARGAAPVPTGTATLAVEETVENRRLRRKATPQQLGSGGDGSLHCSYLAKRERAKERWKREERRNHAGGYDTDQPGLWPPLGLPCSRRHLPAEAARILSQVALTHT